MRTQKNWILVSLMVQANQDSDQPMDEAHLVINAITLLVAGFDNTLYCLLTHPAALATIRAQPKRLSNTLEACGRYESPVQLLYRRAFADVPLGDKVLKPSDEIIICLSGANRDPRHFNTPDQFRFDRDQRPLHFGKPMPWAIWHH